MMPVGFFNAPIRMSSAKERDSHSGRSQRFRRCVDALYASDIFNRLRVDYYAPLNAMDLVYRVKEGFSPAKFNGNTTGRK